MSGILTKISELGESIFKGTGEDNKPPVQPRQPVNRDEQQPRQQRHDDRQDSADADEVLDVTSISDPDDVDLTEGRREYSGMPGNYQVVIRPVYNHIFLSRKYGMHGQPSIKMSWRFNHFGRIDLVDSRLLPEKDVDHLIKVRHFEQLDEPWDEAVAFHYEMPERVSLLNPGFKRLSYPRKYQSIMRFGHSMARDVITSLQMGEVRDSYVLGEQQDQLREIVHDDAALCLLQQAAGLLPSSKMLNRSVMKVYYDEQPTS